MLLKHQNEKEKRSTRNKKAGAWLTSNNSEARSVRVGYFSKGYDTSTQLSKVSFKKAATPAYSGKWARFFDSDGSATRSKISSCRRKKTDIANVK